MRRQLSRLSILGLVELAINVGAITLVSAAAPEGGGDTAPRYVMSDDVPPVTTPDRPLFNQGHGTRTVLNDGVSASAFVEFEVKGRRFRVPAGYLLPWPSPDQLGHLNHFRGFGFAFWMPDKRWVERNPFFLPDFRPTEEGRGPPARESYVVFVRNVNVIGPTDSEGYVTPEQGYKNWITGVLQPSLFVERVRSDLNLVEIERPPGPLATTYKHLPGANPQILIDCTRDDPGINPSCAGNVYFQKDGVAVFVQFSLTALPDWRFILQSARDLIRSWRID